MNYFNLLNINIFKCTHVSFISLDVLSGTYKYNTCIYNIVISMVQCTYKEYGEWFFFCLKTVFVKENLYFDLNKSIKYVGAVVSEKYLICTRPDGNEI